MFENYSDVLSQLQAYGLQVSDLQVDTSRQVRCGVDTSLCPVDNAKRRTAGWYHLASFVINGKSYIVGAYGFWKGASNNKEKVELDKTIEITPEQRKAQAERMRQMDKAAKQARAEEIERAARRAQWIWSKYQTTGQSDYLQRKGVQAHGLRFGPKGTVAVPMMNAQGKIYGLQLIRSDVAIKGTKKIQKKFEPKGLGLTGSFHLIGSPREVCLIAEGYATAATIHENTGLPIAVAFNANNLEPVAKEIKKAYPNAMIVVCADDDYLTDGNPGIAQAEKAVNSVGGRIAIPNFANQDGNDIRNGEKLTDFNDLAMHPQGGPHLVRAQIEAVLQGVAVTTSPVATQAAESRQGDGEKPKARSILPIEDIVQRFMFVDDMTGDNVYDNVTREVVKLKKVQAMLPPKVRWDEVKGHPLWETQAVYSDQIGFDPTEKDPKIVCNRYAGWPTKPDGKASCEKLLTMLQHMCSNEMTEQDSSVYEWVIRWLAYPIQNPGAKMQTALIFHGPQGVGKNKFFEAYRDIYGEYGITITQGAMEDQFNSDWADRKLFVLADEVVAQDGKHHLKNDLKTKVTGDYMRINRKMVEARNERNFMNLCFLSNEINPVVLENRDRRYFVIWTPGPLKQSFYDELVQEIKNGGVEALHHFLKNEVNLEGFGPETKPPLTKAKQDLITVNLSPQETFIHKWVTGEFEQIPFGPVQCEKLFDFYIRWADRVKERYAGSDKHFYSSLKRTGWKKTTRKRVNIGGDITVIRMKNFYDPPIELVEKALKAGHTIIEKTEGLGELDYRTKCYTSFIEGIKDYAEESA